MGYQIMELLDLELDDDEIPSTLPRRLGALACYLYYSFTPLLELQVILRLLVALVGVLLSAAYWQIVRR